MDGRRENILVSACLMGVNCRYDGNSGRNEAVLGLMEKYNLIPVCPEQLGGLETPREAVERRNPNMEETWEQISVFSRTGQDVSEEFKKGAMETLKIGKLFGCRKAILKERSPSCGSCEIYDGTFSGRKVKGKGVTAILLEENGISVTGESKAMDLAEENI